MRRARLLFLCLAALPMAGYTECSYFSAVRVPNTDSRPPIMVDRITIGTETNTYLSTLVREITDPNVHIGVIPSAIDDGGVQALDVGRHVRVVCNDGAGLDLTMVGLHDQQEGGPGSMVSNGVYLLFDFSFAEFTDLCDHSGGVQEVFYEWSSTAVDFHGNRSTFNGGRLHYAP